MTDSRSRSDPFGELEPAARTRVRVGALSAALFVAALVLLMGDSLRQPLFDAYHRLSPAPRPDPRVAVVTIDTPSLAALGGWPWSRYIMARLTEKIAERGAVAIGYDFLFPEADRQAPQDFVRLYPELPAQAALEVRTLPSMDEVFARVIGREPVVLARAGVFKSSYDRGEDVAAALLPPEARFAGPQPAAIPSYPEVNASLDVLDGAAAGHGLANGPPDRDGLVRRVPLLGRAAGVMTPSLALDLVRVAEGDPPITLEGDRRALKAIRIGRHRVPVQPGGQVVLRFTASPPDAHGEQQAAYPNYSAADVLRQGWDPQAFKGKIVLVGLAAAGTSDVVNTVREGRTYGVFVQAQAVDAILRSAALTRPGWAAPLEWSVGLLLVVLSWFAVPRLPLGPVLAGAAAETAAAFGASWLAFQHGWLVDPIPMLAPGAANSALMVAILFVEGRRLQGRLRTALEEQRLSAARISGELAAASEIQSGMLLPRAELARISPAVEIDAVLQPAKTVGGDLYDAFRFDDGRVCFLVGDVTGKGVPASLFMALSKALSRSLLMRPATPLQAAVEEINRELSRDNRQAMAVSLLVGVLRPEDGDLQMVSAGHENPLVVGVDGQVRELKLDGGPPLCVDDGFPYPAEAHTLAPGEILVAFTDGLTEAQAPDGRLFDREAVLAAVADAGRADTLAGTVDSVIARVRAFEAGGEPSDDLTVLAVRRRAAG